MAKGAKVTLKKFNAIKILLKSGSSQKECAECMDVSTTVVGIINKSETFEEYRNKMYVTSGAYRRKLNRGIQKKQEEKKEEQPQQAVAELEKSAPVAEPRQTTVVVQATHYMMEDLRKINETLTLISNKLAFIVDELTK